MKHPPAAFGAARWTGVLATMLAAHATGHAQSHTRALENYTGGRTRIRMEPSWGLGLFAGGQYRINERLHVKLR